MENMENVELTQTNKNALYYSKSDDLVKVIDYFLTKEVEAEQPIYKLINTLLEEKQITETTYTELKYAITQYRFLIMDIFALCDELHIKLYNKNDKNYLKRSNAFYGKQKSNI